MIRGRAQPTWAEDTNRRDLNGTIFRNEDQFFVYDATVGQFVNVAVKALKALSGNFYNTKEMEPELFKATRWDSAQEENRVPPAMNLNNRTVQQTYYDTDGNPTFNNIEPNEERDTHGLDINSQPTTSNMYIYLIILFFLIVPISIIVGSVLYQNRYS